MIVIGSHLLTLSSSLHCFPAMLSTMKEETRGKMGLENATTAIHSLGNGVKGDTAGKSQTKLAQTMP